MECNQKYSGKIRTSPWKHGPAGSIKLANRQRKSTHQPQGVAVMNNKSESKPSGSPQKTVKCAPKATGQTSRASGRRKMAPGVAHPITMRRLSHKCATTSKPQYRESARDGWHSC